MLHLPIQETAREADCKYNKIISKNYKFKLFFHLMLVYDIIFIPLILGLSVGVTCSGCSQHSFLFFINRLYSFSYKFQQSKTRFFCCCLYLCFFCWCNANIKTLTFRVVAMRSALCWGHFYTSFSVRTFII